MPEAKVLDAEARYIQRGDWFVLDGKPVTATNAPVTKQKYVYVDVAERDQPVRLKLGATVRVSRLFPTEEELAQQQADEAHRYIRQSMRRAAEGVIRAAEDLAESLNARDATWHGRRWEQYTAAQVTVELWENVVRVAVAQQVDLVTAANLWAAEITKNILDEVRWGTRSSSDMHNFAVALKSRVQAEWVHDLEWRL